MRTDILHDIFTGDTISYENCVLGDNKYIWSNELIYYVEKNIMQSCLMNL